jgi:MFS family permease
MGFNGLLIVLIELPLCQWAQRFGERRVLMVGFATVGLGCCAFGFADSPATFLAAMFVFTVGEMMSLPIASAYSSRLAPAQMRGRYFGFHGVVWSLAGFAGSAGVWFHGHMGATWWYCTGLLAIVAGFAMTLRVREGGVGLVAPIPDRAV